MAAKVRRVTIDMAMKRRMLGRGSKQTPRR